MDVEGGEASTPRESKKKGVSKAASSLRKLGRRLSKSISSDRGTGSLSSSENAPAKPFGKRFSLRPNRSKKETRSLAERGAVTDREPRRSFSVDDMTNYEVDEEKVAAFDPDVKIPPFADAVQFVQEISHDATEDLAPPDTPVPERDTGERPTGDNRSSSSANVSGNDDTAEVEEKEVRFELPEAETVAPIEKTEPVIAAAEVPEAEEPVASPFDIGNDAEATIDAQIEEAVLASLLGMDSSKSMSEAKHEEETKPEAEPQPEPAPEAEPEMESKPPTLDKRSSDFIEMTVPELERGAFKPLGAVGEGETERGIVKKDRAIDMADLMPQPAPLAEPEPEPTADVAESGKPGASVSKPKRRRRIKIIKSASVYSLATLAVGVLFMIIKNKH